jgi:hypothetical protein
MLNLNVDLDRLPHFLRTSVAVAAIFSAGLCHSAHGQGAQTAPAANAAPGAENKDVKATEAKGLPPRATPADYFARAQMGQVTVAAEFAGHSVPTPQAVFATEDYVTVEVAFFGPPDAHVQLSLADFSLKVNGKKPLPAQGYVEIMGNLTDPQWEPPVPVDKSAGKTSIGGGNNGDPGGTPAPPKMPFNLVRVMQQRVLKADLPEGDRAVPVAGLIYFKYHGKTEKIDSLELTYGSGKSKAVLNLHP